MYLVVFTIAAPLIFAASFGGVVPGAVSLLPPAGRCIRLWPYLYVWWALYWLQFAALEFFFRGFMLHGLVPRLGWAAIFAMVVPYNMLHYGKPMPEALAAIVGGIVLGTLVAEDEVDLARRRAARLDRVHDGHVRALAPRPRLLNADA